MKNIYSGKAFQGLAAPCNQHEVLLMWVFRLYCFVGDIPMTVAHIPLCIPLTVCGCDCQHAASVISKTCWSHLHSVTFMLYTISQSLSLHWPVTLTDNLAFSMNLTGRC